MENPVVINSMNPPQNGWLHRLYRWTLTLAAHPKAAIALFAIAFIESSVFPIPPDVLLIAMIVAARYKAWLFASICTAGSVLGGIFGYGIGHFLLEKIGLPVLHLYGKQDAFAAFQDLFTTWGWWLVLGAGLTPFPYKVITIASGAANLDLLTFIGASAIGRGVRFFLVAWLIWKFGAPIQNFIEKRLGLVCTIGFIVLIGGFISLKFL